MQIFDKNTYLWKPETTKQPAKMDAKLNKCNWIIHLFAVAHALSTFLLGRWGVSDEMVLSLLTITMIVLVTHLYGVPLEVSAAIAILFCFAGFYMGSYGGRWLEASGSPLLIEYSSSICTFVVTEIVGWAAALIAVKRKQ